MNGFTKKAALASLCAGLLGLTTGCDTCLNNLYDPCYPQRYEAEARKETNDLTAPQVMNGHVLDQTVWDYHFEAGSDKLTPGGMEHLAYLARRRRARNRRGPGRPNRPSGPIWLPEWRKSPARPGHAQPPGNPCGGPRFGR